MLRSRAWIILIILLVIGWFFRPLFHPFVMSFIVSPLRAVLVILLLLLIWSAKRRLGRPMVEKSGGGNVRVYWPDAPKKRMLMYVLLSVLTVFGLGLEASLRLNQTAHEITYTDRTELPQFDPLRLIPKGVAKRYADDSFQSPQEYLGDSQIVLVDGKLQRIFPRLPDGGLLYFLNKMSGFVTVEVDTLDRQVSIIDQPFKYAEHIGFFDNLSYQLPLHKYFVNYSNEPIYLKADNDEWVTVVPYMTYTGFPFTVPQWGGVVVIKSDGTMADYTPEQAQQIAYLQGNRIYPKELSEFYADAYAYKNGLINNWFFHKGQTEVVNIPGDDPILHVATTEGFKEMIVAEPYGRSFGIYKIFFFDATTGKRELISFDQNTQLTGPVAAADYIKREFPTYDWSSFSLVEPRPIKIGNDLNWLLSVVPNDYAGIGATVFLDTQTNGVKSAKNRAEIDAIIKGADVTTPSLPQETGAEAIQQKINEIQRQLDELKQLIK